MTPNDIPNRWYWYPTHIGDIIAFMGKETDLGMTSGNGMKLNALRILEHGFGGRSDIRVISRNIGLRPINHNENLFRISKLTRVS